MTELGVTVSVHTDPDWSMEVAVYSDEMRVSYKEASGYTNSINFGSRDEMRAVARAMLAACDTFEQVQK